MKPCMTISRGKLTGAHFDERQSIVAVAARKEDAEGWIQPVARSGRRDRFVAMRFFRPLQRALP